MLYPVPMKVNWNMSFSLDWREPLSKKIVDVSLQVLTFSSGCNNFFAEINDLTIFDLTCKCAAKPRVFAKNYEKLRSPLMIIPPFRSTSI